MKRVMVLLAVVVGVAVAVPVFAKGTGTFNVDGREVSVQFDQRGRELTANGRVKGGEPCKQLNVEVLFDNSKERSTARITAPIKNYKGESFAIGHTFKAATTVRGAGSDDNSRDWYVSDIYLKCL